MVNTQGRESGGSWFETCSGVWYPRLRPCGVAINVDSIKWLGKPQVFLWLRLDDPCQSVRAHGTYPTTVGASAANHNIFAAAAAAARRRIRPGCRGPGEGAGRHGPRPRQPGRARRAAAKAIARAQAMALARFLKPEPRHDSTSVLLSSSGRSLNTTPSMSRSSRRNLTCRIRSV